MNNLVRNTSIAGLITILTSWGAFFSNPPKDSTTGIDIVLALSGVIALIISLISATTSARQSVVKDLEKLVKTLQKDLRHEKYMNGRNTAYMQALLDYQRQNQIWFEDYVRKLIHQLEDNKIKPSAPDIEKPKSFVFTYPDEVISDE